MLSDTVATLSVPEIYLVYFKNDASEPVEALADTTACDKAKLANRNTPTGHGPRCNISTLYILRL